MRGIILGFVALLVLCGAAVSQPFGYVVGPSGGCVLVTGSGGCVGQTSPTFIGQILAPDGTLALPAYSFGSATSTGLYYTGGNIVVSISNSRTGQFNNAGLQTSKLDLSFGGSNVIYGPSAAVTQFGTNDVDTAPVAQTLRTQGALAGGTSNVAGANWTFIASPGKGSSVGGSIIFQTTPAGASGTTVGTPTTVMTLTGPGAITMPLVTTGTNADFLCLSSGAVVLLQTSACTISSARFKTEIKPYHLALSDAVYRMPVVTFRLKDGAKNKDPNAGVVQMGLIAENVAKIMPLCAIYENDMKTPKSYRQECLIAALVKTVQEQHAANDNLARRVARLERRQ